MAPPDIKKMLQVKIKPRKDPYADQFSRIFMVKIMMLTATVTGISWAKDKVCISHFLQSCFCLTCKRVVCEGFCNIKIKVRNGLFRKVTDGNSIWLQRLTEVCKTAYINTFAAEPFSEVTVFERAKIDEFAMFLSRFSPCNACDLVNFTNRWQISCRFQKWHKKMRILFSNSSYARLEVTMVFWPPYYEYTRSWQRTC